MIQFHDPDIARTHRLCPEESAHAVRVLRQQPGDTIYVTDGAGKRYECIILSADAKGCELDIVNVFAIDQHWHNRFTLAVAPTKNMDRMEWMVEKAVEMGVNEIVPLKCSRSERKNLRTDRLVKIAVSAMKQSLKTVLPVISDLTSFADFMRKCKESDPATIKLMGYCSQEIERRRLVDEFSPEQDVIILIGPEGDFTPEEVAMAMDAGFVPVTFGNTRLRTETAAIAALQTLHVLDLINHPESE
ncbi:MAG: 16S rRNA (uracil(1498)-N(3))-methyltransferase [Muribaculaceae bacterium]|nr:16S rRNA (uracil(1498)-N(3))-methyltransferase [Muribaculaceae bacterium]